jgi:hypothetical protein
MKIVIEKIIVLSVLKKELQRRTKKAPLKCAGPDIKVGMMFSVMNQQ